MQSDYQSFSPFISLPPRGYIAATARCVLQALRHAPLDPRLDTILKMSEAYACGTSIDQRMAITADHDAVNAFGELSNKRHLLSAQRAYHAGFFLSNAVSGVTGLGEFSIRTGHDSAYIAIQSAISAVVLKAVEKIEPLDQEKIGESKVQAESAGLIPHKGNPWTDTFITLSTVSQATRTFGHSVWERLYAEFEASVRILTEYYTEKPTPHLAAWIRSLAARDALENCDLDVVDYFLSRVLGLYDGPRGSREEMEDALWWVLNRGRAWLDKPPMELRHYLRGAVLSQVEHTRYQRDTEDRNEWSYLPVGHKGPVQVPYFIDWLTPGLQSLPADEDPVQALLRKEKIESWLQVLGELLLKGTAKDRRFIELIFRPGYEPADIVKELEGGKAWQNEWLRFTRKARRWQARRDGE